LASFLNILGVRIDDVTYAEAGTRVRHWVAQGGVHQIATVNPEFIMAARRDAEFAQVLRQTALNVPDGAGVLWAAQRLGHKLRQRVAGVDLMRHLCALAATQTWRTFFLGATPGVAEQAAAKLAFEFPGLIVAGAHAGSPLPKDEPEIVAKIRHASPQLLFVAFGAPAQDKWLARNLPMLSPLLPGEGADANTGIGGVRSGLVGMGVGGAFDFVTGLQQRAPEAMQRAGLEWLHRLLRDPKRWRRQLRAAPFFMLVLLQSFKR
jgi:N-acetylglucosaminyldiphosphoundecaprenol N-acetyl-beta-D-mannosaminyltransferase